MICFRNLVEDKYYPALDNKTTFPDGTIGGVVSCAIFKARYLKLMWFYENDSELFELQCIVDSMRDDNPDVTIDLYLPYIPNARMDRVKTGDQLFTLKTFAKVINGMGFHRVTVSDPHSNVATALLDRVVVNTAHERVFATALRYVMGTTDYDALADKVVVCYPDAGSAKRYNIPVFESVTCNKCRDFDTGKITSLELNNPDIVKGKTVFIVDDICSYGGTFYHAAKALKEAGASNVILVVTHCENSILKGKLFDPEEQKLISSVFTTNSIYSSEHPNIHVIKL